jgi:bacterioferritin
MFYRILFLVFFMGTKGKEIVGSGVKGIIEMLNKALIDEWKAYYQYWIGSLVVEGLMRPNVQAELTQHATEELNHANLLSARIIQLGGVPVLNIFDKSYKGNCAYLPPKDFDVRKILSQNIRGEQCAILVYQKMLDKLVKTKDYVTFELIRQILQDELEHEQDLEDLSVDIESLKK